MARVNVLFIFILLVCQQCSPRGLPEEDSVVSVYTTQPTTATTHVDVYHQIANNIAERITSPIYRFLGINRTKTEATTKRSWDKVELLDEPEVSPKSILSINNEISDKDVEELSAEALKKIDKKPEKITLYNSYLPSEKIELNDTVNEVDNDTFGFDDLDDDDDDDNDDTPASKRGLFVTALEIIGSIIQLIYGGIAQMFSGYLPK
ncbi:unnamed protein product, partial [Brenthis ino]